MNRVSWLSEPTDELLQLRWLKQLLLMEGRHNAQQFAAYEAAQLQSSHMTHAAFYRETLAGFYPLKR